MSDTAFGRERVNDPLAIGALVCGLAALAAFVFAFATDVLWPVGLVLAAAAAVLGFLALRRTGRGDRSWTMAVAGLVAAGVVAAWFLVWLIWIAFD